MSTAAALFALLAFVSGDETADYEARPVPCPVSDWSDWGACSQSCDGGELSRSAQTDASHLCALCCKIRRRCSSREVISLDKCVAPTTENWRACNTHVCRTNLAGTHSLGYMPICLLCMQLKIVCLAMNGQTGAPAVSRAARRGGGFDARRSWACSVSEPNRSRPTCKRWPANHRCCSSRRAPASTALSFAWRKRSATSGRALRPRPRRLSPQRRRRPLRRMSPQRRSARSRPMRRSSEGSSDNLNPGTQMRIAQSPKPTAGATRQRPT